MPRLTTLDDISFPVKECPVFTTLRGVEGEQTLEVPESKALVNGRTQRVIGIVSRGYRLVTNEEALALAYECCEQVFPSTKAVEWHVDVVDAPASGGHCAIDLIHSSAALNFADVRPTKRPEVFGPFIRVTNSYNGLRALAFDIGFYRKVCRNGLIAPDTIIHFRFAHQRKDLGSGVRFDVAHSRLAKLQDKLGTYLAAVSGFAIPRKAFDRIVRGVLRIRPLKATRPKSAEAEDWEKVQAHLKALCNRYADELGDNGYAVLNAITDFASQPLESRHIQRDRHSLQRLAGLWLSDFSEKCRQPVFSLAEYLNALDDGAGSEAKRVGAGGRGRGAAALSA
jgi:hypothetical protein